MERFPSYKKVTFDNTSFELDTLSAYFTKNYLNRVSDVYKISIEEEARPDLIAWNFYRDWTYWWAIMVFNDIIDPFTELYAGRVLNLPSITDITTQLNAFRKSNK